MAKILLIDDTRFARNILRRILESEGYVICGEASSGREGIIKFRQLEPDLVFCDMMMNEMNGIDFIRAVRSEFPDAKIVICTSVSARQYLLEAEEAGAKDFILKPVNANKLLRVTEKLVGKPSLAPKVAYKDLMEERAAAKGIVGKPVLDFFDAFLQLTRLHFDDPQVDEKYLKEKSEEIIIGVRAFLSAKMSTAQVSQLMDIFRGLTS